MTIPKMRLGGAQIAGVYAPLADVSPSDPFMGGCAWLDWTDNGHTRHPGADLNSRGGGDADLGAPVIATVDGVIEYSHRWNGSSTGYGNYVILRTESAFTPQRWLQYCHLRSINVLAGEAVKAGQQIGECGKSGNQTYAHLHWEICRTRKPTWDFWPYGWTAEQVEQNWIQPAIWFWETVARATEQQGGGAVDLLEDWQVREWILAPLYGWANLPYNPDSGTAQAWVTFLRAGTYLGRPRTEERPYGEGKDAGVWVEFDYGILCYRLSDGGSSITG